MNEMIFRWGKKSQNATEFPLYCDISKKEYKRNNPAECNEPNFCRAIFFQGCGIEIGKKLTISFSFLFFFAPRDYFDKRSCYLIAKYSKTWDTTFSKQERKFFDSSAVLTSNNHRYRSIAPRFRPYLQASLLTSRHLSFPDNLFQHHSACHSWFLTPATAAKSEGIVRLSSSTAFGTALMS